MFKSKRSQNIDNILEYASLPRLEIIGTDECTVDGLRGIAQYTSERIKINLGKYFVTFVGSGLYINSFSPRGAIVRGTIESMEFESYG